MTDIKQFIRNLNEAWIDSRYDDLYEYSWPLRSTLH